MTYQWVIHIYKRNTTITQNYQTGRTIVARDILVRITLPWNNIERKIREDIEHKIFVDYYIISISDDVNQRYYWNILLIKIISISTIHSPNQILLYLNLDIKIYYYYYTQQLFLCCGSWYTPKKYVQFFFKYTVPLQEIKIIIC